MPLVINAGHWQQLRLEGWIKTEMWFMSGKSEGRFSYTKHMVTSLSLLTRQTVWTQISMDLSP